MDLETAKSILLETCDNGTTPGRSAAALGVMVGTMDTLKQQILEWADRSDACCADCHGTMLARYQPVQLDMKPFRCLQGIHGIAAEMRQRAGGGND